MFKFVRCIALWKYLNKMLHVIPWLVTSNKITGLKNDHYMINGTCFLIKIADLKITRRVEKTIKSPLWPGVRFLTMLLIKHHLETTTHGAGGQKQMTSRSHVCLQSSTHRRCVLGRQTTGLKPKHRIFAICEIRLKLQPKSNLAKITHFNVQTICKFCTYYDDATAMLCAKFKSDRQLIESGTYIYVSIVSNFYIQSLIE